MQVKSPNYTASQLYSQLTRLFDSAQALNDGSVVDGVLASLQKSGLASFITEAAQAAADGIPPTGTAAAASEARVSGARVVAGCSAGYELTAVMVGIAFATLAVMSGGVVGIGSVLSAEWWWALASWGGVASAGWGGYIAMFC